MLISVIIPVRNGRATLSRCLDALKQSTWPHWECLVIDDHSTDNTAEIARLAGVRVYHTTQPGPAAARNLGARVATGDILFFLDADVLVQPDTLSRVAQIMHNPSLAACFGSYDDHPEAPNFLSQYRNLLHHYTHQIGNPDAVTFWSGCGAIRKEVFWQLGGFDESRFTRPSIEDIELGYRLRQAGYRIYLEKSLLVTHLKRWTVTDMLVTDIRDRAIPWARLVIAGGELPDDLNLRADQRISGVLVVLGGISAVFACAYRPFLWLVLGAIAGLLFLNRQFYAFLYQKRGAGFALTAVPWHWLYFVYSSLSFSGVWVWHLVKTARNRWQAVFGNR
ncbi:MAG: glycosyltransferase [Chloroflexi bacterium]|nr:MAG: glycosyltransferase [Chloroflexota bacterium]